MVKVKGKLRKAIERLRVKRKVKAKRVGKAKNADGSQVMDNQLKLRPGTYSATQVLEFVKGKVSRQPKRLYMRDWVVMFKGKAVAHADVIRKSEIPECGTVACMAGWIGIATGHTGIVGTGAGLRALGLMGNYAIDVDAADLQEGARAALASLFMDTNSPKKKVIARMGEIMETYKGTLDQAQVVVGRGWTR